MAPEISPEVHGWRRWLYLALGLFFVGLAILGAMLPLLPCTPFVLLAAFFFVRSSPSWHAWLLKSRIFGGLLRDWHERRGVRRSVKFSAYGMIPVTILTSGLVGQFDAILWCVLLVLGAIGLFVVWRLPEV